MPLDPTPSYPASLDTLPDPTETIYEDDDGYEHDLLHKKVNGIVEALEAKLGVGASTAAINTSPFGTGAGSIWDRASRKNLVINGGFRVNQRVTAPTADNAYFWDRWRVLTETSGTGYVVSTESTDLPVGGSRRAAKLAIGSSNNTKNGLFTILESEDIWPYRSQVAAIQAKMRVSDARIGDVRMALVQWTGTADNGGSAFPDPINAWGAALTVPTYTGSWGNANTPANLGVTTSWVTYRIPNISVSGSATNLGLFIWIDDKTTTAGDYLLVTDVQLELGIINTDIERRSFGEELALCQRYYEKSYPLTVAPGAASALGEVVGQASVAIAPSVAGLLVTPSPGRFATEKRATPTTVIYSTDTTINAVRVGGVGSRSGVTATGASTKCPFDIYTVDASSATAIADRVLIQAQWIADAEL